VVKWPIVIVLICDQITGRFDPFKCFLVAFRFTFECDRKSFEIGLYLCFLVVGKFRFKRFWLESVRFVCFRLALARKGTSRSLGYPSKPWLGGRLCGDLRLRFERLADRLARRHERGQWRNNRAENSHQPTRRREYKMQRFKCPGQPKDFSQPTQPPTTLSTSNAISFLQRHTERFVRRL
jgi:hypothetical protein